MASFDSHRDSRHLSGPFFNAENEHLAAWVTEVHRLRSARSVDRLPPLPWMQRADLLDESFRSFHRHPTLDALQRGAPMSTVRFGPPSAHSTLHRDLDFISYRPVCMDASGFFQGAVGLALFEGMELVGPPRSDGASVDAVSWVQGSTFAIGCLNLHIPHCFWELHALFSLAQYDLPALRYDQLWVLAGRGTAQRPLFSSDDFGAIESNLQNGQNGRSFFEEMLSAVAPFVKTIHIANLYEDAGPLCFEQLTVLREPPGLGLWGLFTAEGPNSNCWVGFFSAYESQLFRQHMHGLYSLTGRQEGVRVTVLRRQSTRGVRNLQVLVDVAVAMALQTDVVVMESLSFREQMRQFTITALLLASCGAALVNMALMPAGSHYVEIPIIGYITDRCYYQAYALSLGLRYHDLCDGACDVLNHGHSSGRDALYQDVFITPAQVEKFRGVLGVIAPHPTEATAFRFLVDGP